MPQNTGVLIRTKLHRPRVAGDLVRRSRLLERLERGHQRPLTLVSASAGYGKTSLVCSWLEESDWPNAWVSLDEYDDDFTLFLDYFIAAIQTIFPESLSETRDLVEAPELPPLRVLAATLINELDQIKSSFFLVLDDYHNINETAIHDLLNEVLRHPPRPLYLVLIARRDPPLSLVTLRSRSRMREIRPGELRFTTTETADFLQLMLQKPVEESAAASLTERTEGWITGMRLAVLSLRNRDDLDRLLANLPAHSPYVTDYLVSEVLTHQPLAMLDHLRVTSILDRFCTSLCDAVFGSDASSVESGEGGQAFMDWLKAANLFIVPLDDQRDWYRYQHLFQDLLQRQLVRELDPAEVAVLHRRASDWFAEHGYLDEALRHALAAGDTETAVSLVAQHRHNLLNQELWHTLRRWLGLFSPQLIEKEPELLIAKGWILYNRSQNQDMAAVLDRAEAVLARNASKSAAAKHHQAEIDAMRCEYALVYEADAEQAVALAGRALSAIPQNWFNVRGLVYVILGYGYLMLGQPEQGFEIIYDILKTEKSGSSMFRARLQTALCFLHYSNADMPELGQAATRLLKLGQTDSLLESVSYAHYFLGCFHYLRNELDEAERHLVVAASDRHITQIWSTINSACVLALTYRALDRPEQAQDSAGATLAFLNEMENAEFVPQVQALQAELTLRQDFLDEADRWARHFDPYPLLPMVTFYVPQLTLVKVLLAQDTAASRAQAADLLAKLYDHVLSDKRFMIDVLALQAMLENAQGDSEAALEKLKRAVLLGEPGRFIRPFVDLGPRMADLLNQVVEEGLAPHYINQILDAFGNGRGMLSHSVGPSQASINGGQPPDAGALVDPLTNRELDVLTLLAQGSSNKEIATQLVITPGTVRQHLYNIYQKLQVDNRLQAVATAINLGVLPPLT